MLQVKTGRQESTIPHRWPSDIIKRFHFVSRRNCADYLILDSDQFIPSIVKIDLISASSILDTVKVQKKRKNFATIVCYVFSFFFIDE